MYFLENPGARSQKPEFGGAGGMIMDCPLRLFSSRAF
jgi:hypothetical protein